MRRTTKQKYGINSYSTLKLVVMMIFTCMCGTACFAPGIVRLIDKPMLSDLKPSKDVSFALIIKDLRPESIQKTNMCGVNHQTICLIPVAPIFLIHLEHLDSIVAHHMKKRLEHFGYKVVECYPKVKDELSQEEFDINKIDKSEKEAAWNLRKAQDDKQARKDKKKEGEVEAIYEASISPWGPEFDLKDADFVIEIKIRKFWTYYGYFGSFSWMSANFALCSAKDTLRTVLFGKKFKGFGYKMGFFTPLTPSSDATVSVNMAYWFALNSFENQISSPEFIKIISEKPIDKSVSKTFNPNKPTAIDEACNNIINQIDDIINSPDFYMAVAAHIDNRYSRMNDSK